MNGEASECFSICILRAARFAWLCHILLIRHAVIDMTQFDLSSQDFKRNPMPVFAAMRDEGPVVSLKLPMVGRVKLATTYQAVNELLRDSKRFAMEPRNAGRTRLAGIPWWMPRVFKILSKNMLTTDEPDHRRLRNLVEIAFQRQSVEAMQPRLEAICERLCDDIDALRKQTGQPVDLVKHFARPFPLEVICELLGLPEEDRSKFGDWAEGLVRINSLWGVITAVPGIHRLLNYLRNRFEKLRQNPQPGLMSALVEAEHEGSKLSEDELLAMAFLLLFAGHETTVHLTTTAMIALLQHEDQRRLLTADWTLAPGAVDEVLRYMSPIQLTKFRLPRYDLELCGQPLKQGENVMACLASANCDPDEFEEPETFDILRSPNRHMSFGGGIHICLGLKLARAEVATALRTIFTRFPAVELACDPQTMPWIKRVGIRSVASLPLHFSE